MSDPGEPTEEAVDPVDDAVDRAAALSDVGRHEQAELLLRRALAADADDPALRAALAHVLLSRGANDEALVHADRTVALAPDVGYGHALRAAVLSTDLRRRRDAVEAAREAVRLDPEEPVCHQALGRACLRARWFPEALDAAERSVALDPEDADGHGLRGAALMALGRPEAAELAFREALRLDPEDGDVLHDLGLAVSVQGRERQGEARELFAGAARADPTDQHVRRTLAGAARRVVYGRWGWVLVGLALLRAGIYLFGGDDVARGPGTLLYLLVAAAITAFLLLRGRRRKARLSPAERGALDDARPARRLPRPVTLPTRRRRGRR